jgi:hypothetical protein
VRPPATPAGDAKQLVAALRTAADTPDVTEQLFMALDELAVVDDADAVLAVVAALRTYPAHAHVQDAGLTVLAKLVYQCAGDQSALGACGGTEVLVAGLTRAHAAGDVPLLSACFLALSKLAAESKAHAEAMCAAGAVEACVNALRCHVRECSVVNGACATLYPLVAARENKTRAGAAGIVVAVLGGMAEHLADARVQANACAVLQRCAADDALRVDALRAGAFEAARAAAYAHPEQKEVQAFACQALGRLWLVDEVQRRGTTLAAQAIRVLVAALRAYPSQPNVILNSSVALSSIIVTTDAHKQDAGAAGALRALDAVLKAGPADANAHAAAWRLLGQLCHRSARNTVEACVLGAFPLLVRALAVHTTHAELQLAQCGVLYILMKDLPRNEGLTVAAGAIGALLSVMRACPAPRVWERACAVLHHLTKGNLEHMRQAAAAGALEAVAEGVRAFCADEQIFGAGCLMWLAVARLGDAALRKSAICAGAMDAMQAASRPQMDAPLEKLHGMVLSELGVYAQRHDAGVCSIVGCFRCMAARGRGAMCALPGCGLRKRGDGSGKGLLRCGTCQSVAFCSAAHQREDWGRHKGECAASAAAAAKLEEEKLEEEEEEEEGDKANGANE